MFEENFFEETPFFTDEHRRLAAGVRVFVEREIEPRAEVEEEKTDDRFRESLSLLAQADLLRYSVSAPGEQFDVRALCLIREALAYSSPLADLAFVMQGLGTFAICHAASPHLRNFWLPRAREGRAIAAFALTEPEAGSDVGALETRARRDGDSYIIDGRKRFISNAGLADFYTVFARTGQGEQGRAEISAFVIGARIPGLLVSERLAMISPHPIGELEFEALRVPAENRIGAEGDGFALAMKTLNFFRPSVGAAACGMARRALDLAVAYARGRRQFGVALAEHQLIQEQLAEMATEIGAARLLVYRAAHLCDTGAPEARRRETASAAKLFATEAAWRAIDRALQIHGGNGLIRGHPIERLYRDIRALRIYEGTSEIQKLVIAKQLLRE